MTRIDDRLRPRVAALVAKYGRQVTYVSKTPGYTPDTSTGAPTATNSKTVFVTPPDKYSLYLTDDVYIKKGDCRVFLPDYNLGFVPNEGDQIQGMDGRNWTVLNPKQHSTGEQAGLWELHLR